MNAYDKLRAIVDAARGDDLERAKAAFRGLSQSQMQERNEITGRTRQEILDEYQLERAEWQAASEILQQTLNLLTKKGPTNAH
ncbi:MAG: hypothetical protein WC551_11915 [Patescibacteria group bacterium]